LELWATAGSACLRQFQSQPSAFGQLEFQIFVKREVSKNV